MDTTCPALLNVTTLTIQQYQISTLKGLKYLKNLQTMAAWGCGINDIPAFPPRLKHVDLYKNKLVSLSSFPDSLVDINLDENLLTSLPAIPPTVTDFEVGSNYNLASLPSFPPKMSTLWLTNDSLITCLPVIEEITNSASNALDIRGTKIKCTPVRIKHPGNQNLTIDSLPICDVHNSNGCDAVWDIKGNVYFDSDNNCSTTGSEPPLCRALKWICSTTAIICCNSFTRPAPVNILSIPVWELTP